MRIIPLPKVLRNWKGKKDLLYSMDAEILKILKSKIKLMKCRCQCLCYFGVRMFLTAT